LDKFPGHCLRGFWCSARFPPSPSPQAGAGLSVKNFFYRPFHGSASLSCFSLDYGCGMAPPDPIAQTSFFFFRESVAFCLLVRSCCAFPFFFPRGPEGSRPGAPLLWNRPGRLFFVPLPFTSPRFLVEPPPTSILAGCRFARVFPVPAQLLVVSGLVAVWPSLSLPPLF